MTLIELQTGILDSIQALAEANAELKAAGVDWANLESAYRRSKALAFIGITEGTVQYKAAVVDKMCEKERLDAHLAEARREAAKELVRSTIATLSAYQSLLSSYKAEIQIEKY